MDQSSAVVATTAVSGILENSSGGTVGGGGTQTTSNNSVSSSSTLQRSLSSINGSGSSTTSTFLTIGVTGANTNMAVGINNSLGVGLGVSLNNNGSGLINNNGSGLLNNNGHGTSHMMKELGTINCGGGDIEELTICTFCKQIFNESERVPKMLTCKHYFCLECIRMQFIKNNGELNCLYCWKRTDLTLLDQYAASAGANSSNTNNLNAAIEESLPTYTPILQLTKSIANLKLMLTMPNGTLSPTIKNGNGPSSTSANSFTSSTKHLASSIINGVENSTSAKSPAAQQTSSSNNQTNKILSENCHTHAMPLTFWCHVCCLSVCRACASSSEHVSHPIKTYNEAREQIRQEYQLELCAMNKILTDIQRLSVQQREFLLKILEACITLKTHIETDLTNGSSHYELNEWRDMLNKARQNLSSMFNDTSSTNQQTTSTTNSSSQPTATSPYEIHLMYNTLIIEKQKLQMKFQEMYLQCQLDDLIRNSTLIFDFQLLKQALASIHNGEIPAAILASFSPNSNNASQNNPRALTTNGLSNPILFLANYCMSQLYSRHILSKQNGVSNQNGQALEYSLATAAAAAASALTPPIYNGSHQYNGSLLNSSNSGGSLLQTGQLAPPPNALLPCLGGANLLTTVPPPSMSIPPQQTHQLTPPAAAALLLQSPKGSSTIGQQPSPYLTQHHSANPQDHMQPPPQLVGPPNGPPTLIHSPSQHAAVVAANNAAAAALMLRANSQVAGGPHHGPPTHIYPLYYFQIDVNGQPHGRIVIEVRPDVAPKMAKNFGVLATGEYGFGYKGCSIFQCWEGESVITGDFELNNGRGGRSIYEDGYFMPDDTKLLAIRGAVGMRRTQKRHDNLGMVGSQFRIILQEMRGFTAIFGQVVEGLELVEKISTYGDSAGKPTKSVIITKCGKL